MIAQHTPGPWSVVPYGDGDSLVIHDARRDWRVCFMATPGDSPNAWGEIKANARIIAAAPDLLKALRMLVADFGDYPASERPCLAFDLAHAAIAKATGATA